MDKLVRQGETVFLAMIRPMQSKWGMTQKVKFEQMKKTGPVQKAPPVAETRKRMCSEAPADIRTQLHPNGSLDPTTTGGHPPSNQKKKIYSIHVVRPT